MAQPHCVRALLYVSRHQAADGRAVIEGNRHSRRSRASSCSVITLLGYFAVDLDLAFDVALDLLLRPTAQRARS